MDCKLIAGAREKLKFLFSKNFDSKFVRGHFQQGNVTAITDFIGGSVVLADYCPFMQQVSWSVNNEVIRDSKCIYDENRPGQFFECSIA